MYVLYETLKYVQKHYEKKHLILSYIMELGKKILIFTDFGCVCGGVCSIEDFVLFLPLNSFCVYCQQLETNPFLKMPKL